VDRTVAKKDAANGAKLNMDARVAEEDPCGSVGDGGGAGAGVGEVGPVGADGGVGAAGAVGTAVATVPLPDGAAAAGAAVVPGGSVPGAVGGDAFGADVSGVGGGALQSKSQLKRPNSVCWVHWVTRATSLVHWPFGVQAISHAFTAPQKSLYSASQVLGLTLSSMLLICSKQLLQIDAVLVSPALVRHDWTFSASCSGEFSSQNDGLAVVAPPPATGDDVAVLPPVAGAGVEADGGVVVPPVPLGGDAIGADDVDGVGTAATGDDVLPPVPTLTSPSQFNVHDDKLARNASAHCEKVSYTDVHWLFGVQAMLHAYR